MNEFSVWKLSEVVYGGEGVVSKYRMLRPHSDTDRPFNLFAGERTSHTAECSAVRYGGGGTELPNAARFHYLLRAYTYATPPSTNSSIPVIRRIVGSLTCNSCIQSDDTRGNNSWFVDISLLLAFARGRRLAL